VIVEVRLLNSHQESPCLNGEKIVSTRTVISLSLLKTVCLSSYTWYISRVNIIYLRVVSI